MKKPFRWLAPRWLALYASAALLAGCASTEIKSVWRASDYKGPPMKKVAVFMLSASENMRRFSEDQMARSLPPSTKAVPSYALFEKPEQSIDNVKSRLTEEGFDAVLMARTVSVDKSQIQVPSHTHVVPTGPILVTPLPPLAGDRTTLDSYYRYAWGYTYQTTPSYTANVTKAVVETVLYRLPSGEAVWSAIAESHAASEADMVQELVRLVDKQLAREGFTK
jgi:hypothetical protein